MINYKTLLAMMLVGLLLVACGNTMEPVEKKQVRFYKVNTDMHHTWLIVDRNTGVQYLYTGTRGAMTVLVDKEGKPLTILEGE